MIGYKEGSSSISLKNYIIALDSIDDSLQKHLSLEKSYLRDRKIKRGG